MAARASASAVWLVVAAKTHMLPFSSAMDIGAASSPCSVKTVISIWGKARRIPSASTMGMPNSTAVAIGTSVLTPPTSMGISATGSSPK